MTLSSTVSKQSYAGDGATTAFAIPFLFLANGDIEAILRDANGAETVWIENTHYTLTGAGNSSGGTLTVKTTPADYTPAAGETLVIRRVVAETQGTDYPEGGAFPASAHEQALDRLTMMVQTHSEENARALKYPVSDSSSISAEIPDSTTRASKYLAFDASGAPIASAAPEGGNVVSAFMATVLDDGDAATARTTLGAVADGAVLKTGKHTLWVPAAAMVPRTTSGAAPGTSELTTNKVMVKTLDFDGTAAEHAQFMVAMPKSWDEGTVTFAPYWTGAAGAGGVTWKLRGLAVGNDDALDAAFGTAQASADSFIAANDLHIGPESAAITIAGTPAAEDLVAFEVWRDPADANDTKAEDAKLLGIKLLISYDAGNDV